MLKLFITFILATLLFSACKSGKKTSGAEQQLIRLNNLYDSALVRNDTTTLMNLYADDFIYTNPEGKVLSKGEQITSIAVSEIKWETGRSQDVKVKLYGNMAVMTGAFFATGNFRGNPLTIHERFTAVWTKKDTSWQLVAEQGNIVKE